MYKHSNTHISLLYFKYSQPEAELRVLTQTGDIGRRLSLRRANQWGKPLSRSKIRGELNPLSPHDALKHHFTSLKT